MDVASTVPALCLPRALLGPTPRGRDTLHSEHATRVCHTLCDAHTLHPDPAAGSHVSCMGRITPSLQTRELGLR